MVRAAKGLKSIRKSVFLKLLLENNQILLRTENLNVVSLGGLNSFVSIFFIKIIIFR
jgi:hypothetical protein